MRLICALRQKTNCLYQLWLVGVSPREVDDVPPYGGGLIPTYGLKYVGRNGALFATPPKSALVRLMDA